MTFQWRYINKQVLKSGVYYTFLAEGVDSEGSISYYRVEKSFKTDINLIDDEFLRSEAKAELLRIQNEIDNPFSLPLTSSEDEIVDDGAIS